MPRRPRVPQGYAPAQRGTEDTPLLGGSSGLHSPADRQTEVTPGNGEGSEARIYCTCTQWVWTVTSAETHFKASYKLLGLSAPALLLPPLWPELGPGDGLLVPKQNTET